MKTHRILIRGHLRHAHRHHHATGYLVLHGLQRHRVLVTPARHMPLVLVAQETLGIGLARTQPLGHIGQARANPRNAQGRSSPEPQRSRILPAQLRPGSIAPQPARSNGPRCSSRCWRQTSKPPASAQRYSRRNTASSLRLPHRRHCASSHRTAATPRPGWSSPALRPTAQPEYSSPEQHAA
jgi:hypothetical protein